MRTHVNTLFAQEIQKFRHQYVTDAASALVDAGQPADVVRGAVFLAGLRWDDEHPHLAGHLEEAS